MPGKGFEERVGAVSPFLIRIARIGIGPCVGKALAELTQCIEVRVRHESDRELVGVEHHVRVVLV